MIYCKELANVIMEAEKSQDLQEASLRPRKANHVIPVQIQRGLKSRRAGGVSSR